MARAKKTRRGSPEAIAKRRAARSLNRIFDKGVTATTMDGRTLKRKKRLLKELQEGRRGETLKAHEVLGHVTELMTLGENLTTIRQLKPRVPATPAHTPEFLDAVRSTQRSYNYDARAWRILGINIDAVMAGGSSSEEEGGGGRRRRSARKKKAS